MTFILAYIIATLNKAAVDPGNQAQVVNQQIVAIANANEGGVERVSGINNSVGPKEEANQAMNKLEPPQGNEQNPPQPVNPE